MKYLLAAATMALTLSTAHAETAISVQYPYAELFDGTAKETLAAFNAAHPDIKVTFRTPYKEYEDASQRVLREAVTNSMPDVTFQGLNRVRILADKNLALPLDGFIASEKDFSAEGYHAGMLAAGTVNGKVYGLPYAISLPVVYYNLDLVKKAGGDPTKLPTTWEETIALAKKIEALGNGVDGIAVNWPVTGNWMWQAMVFAYGGTMLNADETKVAFDQDAGKKAINLLARLVTEAGTPNISSSDMGASFAAGNLGMFVSTTSSLNVMTKQVAGKFELKTVAYPDVEPGVSKLPAGGNVAVITAKDPEKQKAAWTFLKFWTGPQGGAIMVKTTGYMAANNKAAASLADYYAANPNQYTAVAELPYFTGWYAFPGENGLKITDVIKDRLQSVMDGSRASEPENVLADMAADVQSLLPRK